VLAAGLERRAGKPVVVYAAENHNHAAEILADAVLAEVTPAQRDRVRAGTRFLNTVIGKMSGVLSGPGEIGRLSPIAPGIPRAFLVESFNRILISAARFEPGSAFRRGIEVFAEKPDLLPFEEAKLYGHNAAHAVAAYIAALRGLGRIEELRGLPGAVAFVRAAFLDEAGEALVRKWRGVDSLFTREGFTAYVDDLMDRMLNPFLADRVERVARDPGRKLSWDDRLVGAIRLALAQGIVPRRLALGAAAALVHLQPEVLREGAAPHRLLEELWLQAEPATAEKNAVLGLIGESLPPLRTWLGGGAAPFA
jgi:mannitol-1-phosphate 5-dehydrogenase